MIETAIVIVNWNGRHLLKNCLFSLKNQTNQDFQVIIVDNGSNDGSVEYLRSNFPEVTVIELIKNTGFAYGSNRGIWQSLRNPKIKNIILLNNDTQVKEDFLAYLLKEESDNNRKKVGAIVPKILLMEGEKEGDEKGVDGVRIDSVGVKIKDDGLSLNIGHGEIDRGQYNQSREVDGFCGGAVLLKREMLVDMESCVRLKSSYERGGYPEYFPSHFFAYYEDADLSLRLRSRGWRIITRPEAVVWHRHSATKTPPYFKAYYLNRNRLFLILRNFSGKKLFFALLSFLKGFIFKKSSLSNHPSQAFKEKKERSNNWRRKIGMIFVLVKVFFSVLVNLPKVFWWRIFCRKRKKSKRNFGSISFL